MIDANNFLHTTHRTVTWFRKAFVNKELELAAPFQRNPVWTNRQKSYLIDTILHGLPIPELYMQGIADAAGEENHIVVDGQQRIRAVLDFVAGNFSLEGDDIDKRWRNFSFDELDADQKVSIFNYKFVVRILPSNLGEEEIRKIFARINKNVVALNEQELRNATYWGPFIKTIQRIADEQEFWSNCGVFSANDYRRMLDHEYISELAIAYLHGPQNKKDKLEHYYQLYEESFEKREDLLITFRRVTSELERLEDRLHATRWKKKSDFYTLFLEIAAREKLLPLDSSDLDGIADRLLDLGKRVEALLRLEEDDWDQSDSNVVDYARNVSRAASDRGSRTARATALSRFVFREEPREMTVGLKPLA